VADLRLVTLFTLMSAPLYASWLASRVVLAAGFTMLALLFFFCSTPSSVEPKGHLHMAVDRSFRLGMMWFIFSEVMFFAAFFGALFYARNLSVPWLSGTA